MKHFPLRNAPPTALTIARRFLILLCLAALLSRSGSGVFAQEHKLEHPEKPQHPDTSRVERDSIQFHFYLPPTLGSIDNGFDTTLVMTRSAMQWRDPNSLAHLIGTLPGVILQDQVQIGQYTTPTIDGVDWRGIAVLWNGRTLSDPVSGVYNLDMVTREYLERVEVVTGPRAFLYGLNSTGGAINLVTRNYNSNRPSTRLYYSESSYGYAQTDGSFAQNISRRMNITAGFHFKGTDGRFANESDESWQVRGKIRFALLPSLTLLASEYFTSTNTNMNGGVNPNGFSFLTDPSIVEVKNTDAYEKITRHDLDLTAVGTFFPDSTDVTTLTTYYSGNLREYRDEESRPNPNGIFVQEDHRSSWAGTQLTQTYSSMFGATLAGAMTELRQVEGSPTIGGRRTILAAAWLKDEVTLSERLGFAAYGRLDRIMGTLRSGIGADAHIEIVPGLAASGGLSISHRVPNFTELYWSDSASSGSSTLPAEEHSVFEAGLKWQPNGESFVKLTLTHRAITHPILVAPVDTTHVFPTLHFFSGDQVQFTDLGLDISLRVWRLLFEGNGTYFVQRSGGTAAEDLPRLRLSGGAYFRDQLFNGNLDLKVGVRGWYRTGYSGLLFNPRILAFLPNTGLPLGRAASVDFVLFAHIGDAQIHFIWENLPSISYFASPNYPGLDRVLRFGLSWDFWN